MTLPLHRYEDEEPLMEAPRRVSLARALALELGVSGAFGAAFGALVGVLAAALERGQLEGPLIAIGTLTGAIAGMLAAITGREVLPRLSDLGGPTRYAIGVLTLLGGGFAATALVFALYPRYALHGWRYVLLVGAINGLLALVAGVLVFLYEDLVKRLARTQQQLAAERLAQAHARERAVQAELSALQARINPHFFFNALNTVAALVSEEPQRAEELLERFAGLFRYAFRRGREREVPLEEELVFIRDYLEIERARFGERLRCQVGSEPGLEDEPIPPLVLQPLVENAVLHGRDAETGEGLVAIRARRDEEGRLEISVRDRGPGPGDAAGRPLRRGHALENIAARVAATRQGRLFMESAPDGPGTLVRIVFPRASTRED